MSCTLGKAWLWLSPVGLWIIFSCPRPPSPVQVPKGAFILTGGSRGEETPWGLHSELMTFKPSYRDTRIPAAFYHIHWLLTHLRLKRLREDLYYWIKIFLETLKSLEDLQQLTMTQTPWAVNLDGVAAKTKYNEMRSCANWAICVTLRDKMNFSDLAFNNKHTQNGRQSINTGRPLFPLLLKEKG